MPTEKPRVTFTISKEKLEELERFQHENRIKNQTQAVLALIEKGLSGYEVDVKNSPSTAEAAPGGLSDIEQAHIKKYRLLDPYGKEAVDGVLDIESRRCEEARAAALWAEREKMEAGELIDFEKVIRFSVPGYAMPMSAGTGQEAGQEYPENYTLVKEPPRGTSFIARVNGVSMEPTYHDGDLVFVHATEEIPVGRIGTFFMDGQQWIKELGDGELISHNPAYAPRPFAEDVKCQGLVLGVCDESYFD